MIEPPVDVPLLTHLLVKKIKADNEAEGERPKAFPTLTRHSDGGKCVRANALAALGHRKTEPMDLAGNWVTWVGKLIHDKFQEALIEAFPPGAVTVEVRVRLEHDLSSGHIDAVIRMPDGRLICYELKTKGSYGFNLSIGLDRPHWLLKDPEGPGIQAKCQGALNALAIGADELRIGVLGLEALSIGYAEKFDFSEFQRIGAEWLYTKPQYEAIALAELERLREIRAWLDDDVLPPRWGLDDDGEHVELNPKAGKYPCTYCPYRSACEFYGKAPVSLDLVRRNLAA